ncbi:MAG TPA: DNA gyrase modulator, partial [Acidimicrobiia bacterium]
MDRSMFDIARKAIEGALAAGATYADARVVVRRHEQVRARNGEIEATVKEEDAGIGVRALIGSSWGFAAGSQLDDATARATGEKAGAMARASGLVPGADLVLADVDAIQTSWSNSFQEDPFAVSLTEKADLLVGVTAEMFTEAKVEVATGTVEFWDTDKWFVSSQGSEIHQHIVESGGGIDATAVGESETQRRSYPQSFGEYQTGGYEVIRGFDLPAHAGRLASEAVQLLSAE